MSRSNNNTLLDLDHYSSHSYQKQQQQQQVNDPSIQQQQEELDTQARTSTTATVVDVVVVVPSAMHRSNSIDSSGSGSNSITRRKTPTKKSEHQQPTNNNQNPTISPDSPNRHTRKSYLRSQSSTASNASNNNRSNNTIVNKIMASTFLRAFSIDQGSIHRENNNNNRLTKYYESVSASSLDENDNNNNDIENNAKDRDKDNMLFYSGNELETISSSSFNYKYPFFIVTTLFLVLLFKISIYPPVITNNNNDNNTSLSTITTTTSSGNTRDDNNDNIENTSSTTKTSINSNLLLKALENDNNNNIDSNNDFIITDVKNGVVACDQAICSQLGLKILQEYNGNAIDATITTALCIGIVNPSSSGLGGGSFILIHTDDIHNISTTTDTNTNFHDARERDKDGNIRQIQSNSGKITEVIDCREVAPNAAYTEMYLDSMNNNNNNNNSNYTYHAGSVLGGLAIAVPGELRGLELAHQRYGKLSWKTVVQPVLELIQNNKNNNNGITVSRYLAHNIQTVANGIVSGKIEYHENWGLNTLITNNNDWNNPLQAGDKLPIRTKLISTIEDIMNYGSDALYTGIRAQSLASDIQAVGGIITEDDINSYKPTIRTPIVAYNVNGFSIIGIPPPSSGGAVIIGALRFLSGFIEPSISTFIDTLSIHRIAEAMKHVFSIRMSLSDPAYNTETVQNAVRDLINGTYMDTLRSKHYSDDSTVPIHYYGGTKWSLLSENEGQNVTVSDAHEGDRDRRRTTQRMDTNNNDSNSKKKQQQQQQRDHQRKLYRKFGYLNDAGTSHFSIIDKDGNAVSMTTSINTVFGSMVVSPSTGILLGNTMDDFANPGAHDFFGLKPSESNYIMPGKKPLSSMSPTLIFQDYHEDLYSNNNDNGTDQEQQQQQQRILGNLFMSVGGSGGPKIITAVLQVILNHIWFGKSMLESIIHPRIHDQLIYHGGSVTTYERTTLDHLITNTNGDILIEVSQRTRDALTLRKHELAPIDYTGCVQAIAIDPETKLLTGACDVRKGGSPAGY